MKTLVIEKRKQDESVLCFTKAGLFKGIDKEIYAPHEIDLKSPRQAMSRELVDHSNLANKIAKTFTHIIPYILVVHGEKVLGYKRKGTESKLHDKISIGIGGHVQYIDPMQSAEEAIHQNIISEIHEEIGVLITDVPSVLFAIKSDVDEVSRRHTALVCAVKLTDEQAASITLEEDETGGAVFYNIETLNELFMDQQLEAWSAICIERLVSKKTVLF